jgi:5-methylcytosine-specific restriction endonuclease McrA
MRTTTSTSERAGRRRPAVSFSQNVRDAVIDRFGGKCAYCGEPATCVDHVVPFSYGGTDADDNLVASCRDCNQGVYNKVFDTFEDKKKFILDHYGPNTLWREKQERKRLKTFTCADCGDSFDPREEGASNLLCPKCYD